MKRVKRLFCILLAAVLCGCVKWSGSYEEELNRRVERAVTSTVGQPNYSHSNYSYYREPIIGRISSDETSNTFLLDDVKFVMNLRISSIINKKYYSQAPDSSMLVNMDVLARSAGTFTDYDGDDHSFDITLYRLGEGVYVYMLTDQAEFFAIANELQALQLAETMVRMARSLRVDTDAVIAEYSSKQTIDYTRKRLELFQNIVPENGVIEELYEGYGSYAGQADGEFFGDNYTDDTIGSEGLDFSQGDEQLDEYPESTPNPQQDSDFFEDEQVPEEGAEYVLPD